MTTRVEPHSHFLAAAGVLLLLAPAGAPAESSDLLANRLARCVADLNSDEFSVRQRATRELENAGVEAVPLVAAAVKSNDKEVRSRAVGILLAQACSKNAEQRSAARAALAELSQSLNDQAADAAQAALKIARDGAAALATAELTRLGAMVERKSSPGENAGLPHYNVMVPQSWTGGDNGLALASELGDVPFLTMENAPLSDACLIHVAKLTGLTRLYVGSTHIMGSSLARLAPLTRLQFLSLRQLPIDDARLARLPPFEHLHYLGLDGTQVGDRGLRELARYPRLQMLWLDRTRVSDAGLVHLQALPELYTLFLAGTKVGGPGLAELRHLPRLSYLSLKGNKLERGSLKLLGELEQLETLALDETNVSDDQLADLAGHSRLRKLYLTKTDITDAGLEHLQSLRNLDTLYISETEVSSEGIDGLRKALPNCDVRREEKWGMDLLAELARYGPGAPPTAASAAEARAYCRRLAEKHYENFSVVSHLFPRHLHQPLCNVYAYCRWADDLADETANPQQSLALLDWWQQQLERLYAGVEPTHPVFVALGETIRKFDLPRQPLTDLLVAFRRDQTQTRYETLADLLTYCEKSANPVGRIVLALGRSANDENVRLSDAICTGLQLANFCQDVKRDYDGGRIYLPQELCRRHGWHVSRFTAGRCDNDFRELLRSFVFEAETRLMEGEGLARRVGPDLKMAVRVFSAGGFAILAAIRRCRYDVWSRRPTVGRLTKLRLIASAWWTG